MRNIDKAKNDPSVQALILEMSRRDVVWWVNNWVYTFDPRRTPSNLPFLLFPRQAEYLMWRTERYETKTRGLVDKSRDMGVTWLNVAWHVHRWLFEPGFKGTFGSRKVELVDRIGDPDSIFEKARMILRMLPAWMMPDGFDWKKHDNHLRLINPANGSSLTGEGGDNMGRGGRSSIYDVDEAAFIERPQKVEAAISQNSDCIIETSTPNGMDNPFAMRRFAGKVSHFQLHWKDDPRKGDAWYQKQVDELDPVTVAQEIDIDYAASKDGIVIQKGWIDEAISRALYDGERGAISIGGDIARFGRDCSAAAVREGRNVLHLDEWQGHELDDSAGRFIALGLKYEGRLKRDERLYFFIDVIGVGAGVVPLLRNYIRENKKTAWVVVEVNVAEKSPEEKCKRKRDALWWRSRKWFSEEQPAISSEICRELRTKLGTELNSPTYKIGPDGLIIIESKDDMKKRGVASPNLADALIHTFDFEAMKPKEKTLADELRERAKQSGGATWRSG